MSDPTDYDAAIPANLSRCNHCRKVVGDHGGKFGFECRCLVSTRKGFEYVATVKPGSSFTSFDGTLIIAHPDDPPYFIPPR